MLPLCIGHARQFSSANFPQPLFFLRNSKKMTAAVFNYRVCILFQERLSHGISSTGFPGSGHRVGAGDFQHPYFPPPFPSAQQTTDGVFAAQAPHLADPYNVNSLHFQTSQVQRKGRKGQFQLF